MRVYRVEDSQGNGPYYRGGGWFGLETAPNSQRPMPFEDGLMSWDLQPREIREDYYFGFEFKQHICNWFTQNEMYLLHENKFNISIYECDEKYIQKGGKQLVFKKKHATLINTTKPLLLLNEVLNHGHKQ